MKVALVYDRINKWGGAERVLLALHKIWPEAPLYTSVYDKRLTSWADVFDVRTSFLQKLPLPKNKHEYYPFLMGLAFETFNFDEYDVVVSVTHEFAKAIITKPKTLHLCYCLTPTSYLWSGHEHYFSSKSRLFRTLTAPMVRHLRWYDKIIAHRPDRYVAISQVVKERIKKYYGLDSQVIYPPVSTIGYQPPTADQADFFLVVSRLVPNKRVDIAVSAFNQSGLPLKVIGKGFEEKKLKSLARDNIEFLSGLTDEELARYYSSCRAVIIPGEEDFSLVAVEAQSFGKPVIAYAAGGVLETVSPGKTGWFFSKHNARSLADLVKSVDLSKINARDCIRNASRFSEVRFAQEFRDYVRGS